ncbi:MAG: single-stranded DNA-binding protein [Cellulosilyticaceae bacterium]
MNQVNLMGNLAQDLELKQANENGRFYTQFRLAVDNKKKKEKETYFFDVVAFGKKAQLLSQNTKKGEKIVVIGSLQNSEFMNKEGIKNYRTKIVLDDFEVVGKKKIIG